MTPFTGLIVIKFRASVGKTSFRTRRKASMRFAAELQGNGSIAGDIAAWEDEGGAVTGPHPLKCSQVQLKWRLTNS
jgi:hypothetical protein